MPKTDHFFQIGQVLKSNGTDGQVVVGLRGIDAEDISEKEPVFIFFDELPVPYFVRTVSTRGNNKILCYLTDVNTLEDAEEIAGKGIFLPEDEDSPQDYDDFTGWTLYNCSEDGSQEALVGTIDGIEPIPGNPLLAVGDNFIPLHEDLIEYIDEQERKVVMHLPEGLFEE